MEPEAYDELYALEATHWWYEGMRHITSRLLDRVLDHNLQIRILDAGCGTGGNVAALAHFGKVIGIDYSPLALGYARRDNTYRVARASVESLPYPSNAFDLVTTFDVIVCYEVKDDLAALREFARVTRPGGYVLVRVAALPALRGPHDTVVHGVRRYVAPQLRHKLVEAGLNPQRITYVNSLLMPFIFIARKLQNLAVMLGAKPASDVGQSAGAVDRVLRGVLDLEARWIGDGHNFPAGVSLLALARKPDA